MSNLISVRLDDEILLAIDEQVGIEGVRNRSDFIRESVKNALGERSRLPGVEKVAIEVGSEMKHLLGLIHLKLGHTPEQTLKISLDRYVEQELTRLTALTAAWQEMTTPGYDGLDDSQQS